MFEHGFVGARKHMAFVPGLLQVPAMVDRDAVEPRAPGSLPSELIHFAESLEEHVMRRILGFLRIAKESQGQIINRTVVLVVESGKVGGGPANLRLFWTLSL